MPTNDYRSRVYDHYSSARHTALAPTTVADLRVRAPYLERVIARHFPADRSAIILDVGCGHGPLVQFARRAGYSRVSGVDRSPEQVAAAARLGIEGVREGDIMESLLALPEASQDVIVAFDVIEHFRRDELLPLVDAVRRALKPGGRWIIHTPNAESPFFGRIRYGDLTHEEAFTRTSIGQLLLSSGFRDVRCFEDTPVPHGVASAMRGVLCRVIRFGLRAYLIVETGGAQNAILTQNFLTVATK